MNQSTWLFSKKWDILLFTGPIIVAYLVQLTFNLTDVNFFQSMYPFFIIFFISDGAHVYMTYYLSYLDRDELKRKKYTYLFAPLIICLLVYLSHSYFEKIWTIVFATYTLFHFIKQQNAWYFITASKIQRNNREVWIDKFAAWSSTWGITILSLSDGVYFGWFKINDLPHLPTQLYPITLALMICSVSVYIGYYIYKALMTKNIHWAKHHILLTAFIVWYLFRLSPEKEHTILSTLIMLLHHSFPYIYLTSRQLKSVVLPKYKKIRSFPYLVPYVLIGLYLLSVILSYFQTHRLAQRDYFFELSQQALKLGALEYSIWIGLSVFHYYIDGFYWKRNKNSSVRSLFSS